MKDEIIDAQKVYEIGYLLVSSVPGEKVASVTESLKNVLLKKGAVVIEEESAELIPIAYTMVKKIGTANHRFDEGYFGWIKFELGAGEIEEVKKTLDLIPEMLRFLLITTVRESTYLGKKALVTTVPTTVPDGDVESGDPLNITEPLPLDVKPAPASVEEMDKSIDEMVKGA
jgi:ribosomal protein S6